jgi:hypothetical protein
MAHTCNPSYTGGRDQEDCKTLSWKNPPQKRADGVVQGVGPEFKPQYHKKKKKKKKKIQASLVVHPSYYVGTGTNKRIKCLPNV